MYERFSTLKLYIPFCLNGINSCTKWSVILELPPVTSTHLQVFACKYRTQCPRLPRLATGNWSKELANSRDWLWLRGCVGNLFAFLLNSSMFDKQSDYNLRQHNILQETSTDLTRAEKGRRSLASEKFWLSCDFSHAVRLFALHLHQTTLVKLMKWSLSGLVQMTLAVTLPEHFISMKILFSANGV